MRRPVTLPPELIEQARAFASGERTPVAPRNAATVLLLRPGASGHGFEVFVMVRRRSMAFAAGAAVVAVVSVMSASARAPSRPAAAWSCPSRTTSNCR